MFRNIAENVYLHSHEAKIPLSHQEGRKVSSNGNQVTGYSISEDLNNEWIVELAPENIQFDEEGKVTDLESLENLSCMVTGLPPTKEELDSLMNVGFSSEQDINLQFKKQIQNNDLVRLKHALTGNYLLTHDVASPLTMTNMEVTTFAASELELKYNNTLFRVDFFKAQQAPSDVNSSAQALVSNNIIFRLKHESTGAYIRNHRQNLPSDWGFQQREINAVKNDETLTSLWVIENVQWPSRTGDKVQWTPTHTNLLVPSGNPLGFVQKFIEHQILTWNNLKPKWDNSGTRHPYTSNPLLWPFMTKGISMWDNILTKRQIYLIGNPILWWLTIAALVTFITIVAKSRFRYVKNGTSSKVVNSLSSSKENITKNRFNIFLNQKLLDQGGFLFAAYLFHFIPFVFLSITTNFLFISNYLPAFSLSLLLLGVVLEHLLIDVLTAKFLSEQSNTNDNFYGTRLKQIRISICVILFCLVSFGYYKFAPLTYGLPLTTQEGEALRWLSSWEYLVTLHPYFGNSS